MLGPDNLRKVFATVDKLLIPKPAQVRLADGQFLQVLQTPHFLTTPIIREPTISPAPSSNSNSKT